VFEGKANRFRHVCVSLRYLSAAQSYRDQERHLSRDARYAMEMKKDDARFSNESRLVLATGLARFSILPQQTSVFYSSFVSFKRDNEAALLRGVPVPRHSATASYLDCRLRPMLQILKWHRDMSETGSAGEKHLFALSLSLSLSSIEIIRGIDPNATLGASIAPINCHR